MAYLRSLMAASTAPSSSAAPKAPGEAPAPGMKLLKKKDQEPEGLFAGSGKRGKGARREAAKALGSAADKAGKVR